MILLWSAAVASGIAASGSSGAQENMLQAAAPRSSRSASRSSPLSSSTPESDSTFKQATQQEAQLPSQAGISSYERKLVQSIEISGVEEHDREHILQLLPQKVGEPLDRGRVRDSIRALYGTGRFADIQAEVTPSGDGVTLGFRTSANFFVGA